MDISKILAQNKRMPVQGDVQSHQPSRLLVVDDEPIILQTVKSILKKADYDVTLCESAGEALRQLEMNSYDCVITDAIMPVTNGFEFVKAIREKTGFKELPILMLTRKRLRQDVKKAVELGVTDYVIKPIDEHLLLNKVDLCLKKGMGKQHFFRCTLNGAQSLGEITLRIKIISISETLLTCHTSFPISSDQDFRITAQIFEEMGIDPPMTRLLACHLIENENPSESTYEIKLSFVGASETELQKIRFWLNQEELRRRK